MSDFSPEIAPQLKALFDSNALAITESLNQCFDEAWSLEFDDPSPVDLAEMGADAGSAGLIVYMTVGDQQLLVAIPTTLPLPDWVRQPNMSQTSRLETLAMEWSMNCLPEELPCDQFGTVFVMSLATGVDQCGLPPGAMWIPVNAISDKGASRFYVILTAERLPVAHTPEESASDSTPYPVESSPTAPAATPQPNLGSSGARLKRLLKLPVHVAVKLAEKRIPLGQFLALSPGAIVTFDKSCEDLLELYVNNSLYARGEAVKIGEKFGLKVNEVGSVTLRASAVLHPHR
jgi:flagellar motor switch protein FliN/FliY